MKLIVAPDKFKGSLTAQQVCDSIRAGILTRFPDARVDAVPLADGGEGTLDLMIELLGLRTVDVRVKDPLFRDISSYYAIKGDTAYVEMALASGLQLLADGERSALHTSSWGTGQLVQDAIANGARNIYLFVGGSATNDGGIGMASALGFEFLDAQGKRVHPTGANLGAVQQVVTAEFDATITLVTDVHNTLLGEHGAAHVYAKQKGATGDDIAILEAGLSNLAGKVRHATGIDVVDVPGAGAAGGMAASVVGLLNGNIAPGIDSVLQAVRFEERLQGADLVITGEGKVDEQTLQGKVVSGVSAIANKHGIPCVAFCGICTLDPEQLQELNLDGIAAIKQGDLSTEYCLQNAGPLLVERVADLLGKRVPEGTKEEGYEVS